VGHCEEALHPATCVGTTPDMEKVNLAEKLASFTDHWNPRVLADLNGQQVKVVKFVGPFTWHFHALEDELFLVLRGSFQMQFRDKAVDLHEGEFIVVPRGVEHRPVAEREVEVLLFEPASTLNTGNVVEARTVASPERI
jgi:mannose-6-phosphate isomerase-like protein (cupin superfamily)